MTFKAFATEFIAMGVAGPTFNTKDHRNEWSVHIALYPHKTNLPKTYQGRNFNYFTGTAIVGEPKPEEVLQCMHSDHTAAQQKFTSFYKEFGYTDIDEAEKVYAACLSNSAKLRSVLGPRWNQFLQCREDED